jgi:hypothetical protein
MELIGEFEIVEKAALPRSRHGSSRRNTVCPMATSPMIFPGPP